MIHRTQVTFSASGDSFRPSTVPAPFSRAHDPGDIGQTGRFQGKPQPRGYGAFHAPENAKDKITWVHQLVMPLLPALRKAGADDFSLGITYHCDSGAIGFSKEEVRMIADLGCGLPIDCLIEEEPNQAPEPTAPSGRGSS